MLHATYEINQYVIFKYHDEWQEGRIIDIVVSDGADSRTYYKVLSLSTLLEIPTLLYDHILQNNSDNIKKIRLAYEKIPVSKEIRGMIEIDRSKASNNRIFKGPYNMDEIFTDFSDFLIANKIYLSKEEIQLSTEGLRHIFDHLIGRVLLSNRELKYIDNFKRRATKKVETVSYLSKFGIVYGVRVVYYVLKDYLEKIKDPEVKFHLFEFLVYFLDFCSINMHKYFDKKYYE